MDAEKVLINIVRYIHASYDVDIGLSDPNLETKLKRFMAEKDDAVLKEYWDEYQLSLRSIDGEEGNVENKHSQTVTYYRGY